MRITFLSSSLNVRGGTTSPLMQQARALADRGHRVQVVGMLGAQPFPRPPSHRRLSISSLIHVLEDQEPVLHVPGSSPPDPALLDSRASILVPKRWDAAATGLWDVALERYLPTVSADILVTAESSLLGAAVQLAPPQVRLVHRDEHPHVQEPVRLFGPQADLIVASTSSQAARLRAELGASSPRVIVIPPALETRFRPRSLRDQKLIMASGRLVADRRFGHLIRAFAMIRDDAPGWRLRILGDGPMRQSLFGLIRRLGLFDQVEMPGPAGDSAAEWAKASIAALSSRTEERALPILEAMAAGVPVVSYDCPDGPREVVVHGENGLLVPTGDIPSLATALLQLIHHDDQRDAMGEAAVRATTSFGLETIAGLWESTFQEVRSGFPERAHRATRRHLSTRMRDSPPVDAESTPARPPLARDGLQLTPALARSAALSLAVSAADKASAFWFVIPPHREERTKVVVPYSRREDFLAELGVDDIPWLSVRDPGDGGWDERRGPLSAMSARLRDTRSNRLVLEPWPHVDSRRTHLTQGCGVEIEFWADTGDKLVAGYRNTFLTEVPVAEPLVSFEVDGVPVRTVSLMTRPLPDECRFPIDVVYTWVDDADSQWQAERTARLGGTPAADRTATGAARYANRDELKYSMRSIHLFAPWVRDIHIVTADQTPTWLDVTHPRVHLVSHRDILPSSALPTFNSHAIETGLHRISGLAPQYIYFNDDVFLGRPVRPEQFFNAAGQFAVFEGRALVGLEEEASPVFLRALLNNRRLLERDFGRTLTTLLAHTPHPQRIATMTALEDRYAAEFDTTAHAPFRSSADISVASSLAQHFGLITGDGFVGQLLSKWIPLVHERLPRQLDSVLQRDQDAFCVADHHDYALPPHRVASVLRAALEEYFPIAAPWER